MKNPKTTQEIRDLYADMRARIRDMQEYGATYGKLAAASGLNERWFKRFMQGLMPDPNFTEVVCVCKAINFKLELKPRAVPVKPVQVE
jgi:DNA-binding phage protein